MPESDWTTGPAKWFAVGVLGVLAGVSLTWSALRSDAPARMRSATALVGIQTTAPGVGEPPVSPAVPATTAHATSASGSSGASPLAKRININTAPASELELLPGIGPALAQRIVEDRGARGTYRSIDDLKRVRGIGPKIFERLRDHARVE